MKKIMQININATANYSSNLFLNIVFEENIKQQLPILFKLHLIEIKYNFNIIFLILFNISEFSVLRLV